MRYIQIALCIILMIRIGGMIRRKTNVKEGRHWIWSMYVETGILFALAYKEVFYTGIESLILYHICLVYTLVYEIKKTNTLVLKIVWAIGIVVFSCLMTLSCKNYI